MTAAPRICLVHPNPGEACETFIQTQIERLPGVVRVLHGGHMPLCETGGGRLFPDLSDDPAALFSPHGEVETQAQERAAEGLAAYLRKARIAVVLAHYGPTGVALAEPCRRAGVPLVAHFHGFDASLAAVLEKYRRGYARLFASMAACIAVSPEMARDLRALGAPWEKIGVNPCGVDTELFSQADPTSAPPHFAAVGRFVDKKAPEATLVAFARVAAKHPEARLTMAGDGVLRDGCMRLARHLGIAERCDFPGSVPHARVGEIMRASRAFVQHSLRPLSGDKEGMPVAIIEAGASGLPVVATRHAGIPEAVVHGQTGLLCDEMDVPAMAAHMERLLIDPEEAGCMGRAAREHVRARFDVRLRIAELERILRTALARHSGEGTS